MGPPLVGVPGRVVFPLGEDLAGEAVPVPVKQRLPLCLGHHGKAGQVLRIVLQKGLVVKDRAGHENPAPLHDDLLSPGPLYLRPLHNGGHGGSRCDEPLLDPPVAHAAGVGGGPHVDDGPGPRGPVPGKEVAVLLPGEVGQLVKADVVVPLALVVDPVLGVLHGAEIELRPAPEGPAVLRAVVPRPGKGRAVKLPAPVDELGKLGIGLPQDQPPVVGDVDLPQRLHEKGVGLSPSRRPAVEDLVLRPPHKGRLPGLGLPENLRFSHPAHFLFPPAG